MTNLRTLEDSYTPVVEGSTSNAKVLVVGGMGGSAFPAFVLRSLEANAYVIAHQDYGMPRHIPEGAQYIAVSYSGDTEETLSFAQTVLSEGLPLSVVTSGGKLLALAREYHLPYVRVPEGVVPREAILMLSRALLALVGQEHLFTLKEEIAYASAEEEGETLSNVLKDATPVFYSSTRNEVLARFGKIMMNETAKVPAFWNVFPELNHNELQGYAGEDTDALGAVFLMDASDSERVRLRMEHTEALLRKKGVRTVRVLLPSSSRAEAFLYGRWLLRHTARLLAKAYDVDPDKTPLIDAFKREL